MKSSKLFLTILLLAGASTIKAEKIMEPSKGSLAIATNDFGRHQFFYESKDNSFKSNPKLNNGLDTLGGSKKVKTHRPSKKDMNGYIKSNSENYRLYNNTPYKIVDTAGFIIYYLYKNEPAYNGKGLIKTDEYFFSTKEDGAIQRLTIDNLKKAYPERHQFHYDIDALFKSDKDLLMYDNFTHAYKIKYLFLHSVL